MKLKIFTLKGLQYDSEVISVNAKTAAGEITVLNNHRPLITILKRGEIRIAGENGIQKTFPAKKGFMEVSGGNINILAD